MGTRYGQGRGQAVLVRVWIRVGKWRESRG